MPSKEVGFHEEALAEAQAAYGWYATRNTAAAAAFIDELDVAMEQIEIPSACHGLGVFKVTLAAADTRRSWEESEREVHAH